MSETPKQYAARMQDEALRRRVAAERQHTLNMVRGCKTDDEKYERVRDAAAHAMIWSMTHVPRES